MKKSVTLLAGATLAMSVGSAMGAIQSFEDDDLDFLFRVVDGVLQPVPISTDLTNPTEIQVGDVLIAALEFNKASIPGLITDGQELTGISVTQITESGSQPYSGGYNAAVNAALGGNFINVTGGEAGGGAMIAMWLDASPDLDISSDLIDTAGGFSCSTAAECYSQASDGVLYQVDGIERADDFWLPEVPFNPTEILLTSASQLVGNFRAGLSVLDSGISGATNAAVLDPFPYGTGDVAVLLSGSLQGGGYSQFLNEAQRDSLIASGYVATSDFQLSKDIPAPATLALVGAGLLGFRLRYRRRA